MKNKKFLTVILTAAMVVGGINGNKYRYVRVILTGIAYHSVYRRVNLWLCTILHNLHCIMYKKI